MSAPAPFRIRSVEITSAANDSIQSIRWTIVDRQTGGIVAVFDTWIRRQRGKLRFHPAFAQFDSRYLLDRVWYPQIPLAPLEDETDDCLMTPVTMFGQLAERLARGRIPERHERGAAAGGQPLAVGTESNRPDVRMGIARRNGGGASAPRPRPASNGSGLH